MRLGLDPFTRGFRHCHLVSGAFSIGGRITLNVSTGVRHGLTLHLCKAPEPTATVGAGIARRTANISHVLRDQPKAESILVHSRDVLRAEMILPRLVESIWLGAAARPAGILAQVLDSDEDTSMSAIFDALAVGRRDPRVLVGLRYVLRALGDQAQRAEINVLSHATPHPDILWNERNWLSNDVKSVLCPHFRWTPDEVIAIGFYLDS